MKLDKIYLSLALLIILTTFSWFTSCTHLTDIANIPEICFTGDVLPIFINNCAISGCHDGGGRESRMALNNYADISQAVVPGNPNGSRLYQAIITKWGNMMPPKQPLSEQNRTIIRLWIEQGAAQTVCTDTTHTGGSHVARACFTRDILPVIVSYCATTGCHDAASHKEGYNYTTYTNIINSVTPGNPGASRLYTVITSSGEESKMPPLNSPQLSTAQIDSIGKWISYGALNETCGEVCDTINPVTFSGTIWPLMQTSCTGCHTGASPGGGIALANYANVQAVAANGSLINSLTGTGVPKMPLNGAFSTCQIREFEIWVNNGSLNN
ncbi:MAG: c-type cytochrome domain-containing protein [Bacteroidales bacterium]|jgi:mono/diheme cytochrome c family protein